MDTGLTVMLVFLAISALAVGYLIASLFFPKARLEEWMRRTVKASLARDYDRVEACCQKILQLRPKLRDPADRLDAELFVESNRGFCFEKRGDFLAAEQCYARAMQLLEQGNEQPRTSIALLMAKLAVAQHAQGKADEMTQSMTRLREVCAAASEDDAHQIAELITQAAHGAALSNGRDLAFEIVRIAQSVLDRAKAWGAGAIAHTQIVMAAYYMQHCEYGAARELIETAMRSAGDELDRNDADLAHFNLGWIYTLAGNAKAAKEAYERSLEIRSEEGGRDSWHASIVIGSLADLYSIFGEYHKAKRLSDQVWKIQTEQLPPDDSVLATTAVNRAMLLIKFGLFEEADRLLADAERVADETSDEKLHAWTPLVQGLSWHIRLRYHRAAELLLEARKIAESVYGVGHRMTCDYRVIQGVNLVGLKRYDEAETILRETLAIRESLPDVSVIDHAELLGILADLYVETGRLTESEQSVLRARSLIDDRLSATHLTRASINETLGRIRLAQSQFDAAIGHFRDAISIREQVQPANHPSFARLLEAYAEGLAGVGDAAKAAEQLARAQQIRGLYNESSD